MDREERTPSLLVDFSNNTAFDFGTGKKYDVVSIVQLVKRCSVGKALEYISNQSFSPIPLTKAEVKGSCIRTITEVKHPALVDYLWKRKLLSEVGDLKEIHYTDLGKTFFGVGFKNDSGGYEISSALKFKRCLGRKDITSIKKGQSILRMFESWSDYLSFKVINKCLNYEDSDYVILNSVSMIQRFVKCHTEYLSIELFMDNDRGGDMATELLQQMSPDVRDQRSLYSNYKDLNEFLKSSEGINRLKV